MKKLFTGLSNSDIALYNVAMGLLTTCPEGSEEPYAEISEVMGGSCYYMDVRNLDEIVAMADRKWTPMSGIDVAEGVQLNNDSSELDVIIQNLLAYERKRQGYSMADVDKIKKPSFIKIDYAKKQFRDVLMKFLNDPNNITSQVHYFDLPNGWYGTLELKWCER